MGEARSKLSEFGDVWSTSVENSCARALAARGLKLRDIDLEAPERRGLPPPPLDSPPLPPPLCIPLDLERGGEEFGEIGLIAEGNSKLRLLASLARGEVYELALLVIFAPLED